MYMGNNLIAFLFAIGIATWVGNMFYKRTGGNTPKAVGSGAVVGILAFIVMLIILALIPK